MNKKAGKKKTANNPKPIDYSKPLKNAKYERFCQEYIVDNNGTQAAIRAGYSEKTARSQGQRLLTNVDIKNRLAYLQVELSEKSGITIKAQIERLEKIAKTCAESSKERNTAVKAIDLLLKHLGGYEKDNSQRAFILKIS